MLVTPLVSKSDSPGKVVKAVQFWKQLSKTVVAGTGGTKAGKAVIRGGVVALNFQLVQF